MDLNAPIWEFAAIRITTGQPVQKVEFFIDHDAADWVQTLPQSFQDDYRHRYLPLAALDEGKAAEEIHFMTNGANLIGCNLRFDMERIDPLLRRHGIDPAYHYHLDDIASMAAGYLAAKGECPPRPWKSDQLAEQLGVHAELFDRHTALGDVRWTQAQYNVMFGSH